MREPVSSTAINRNIPDLTSRRNTRYDKFLCAWKKVNSNSLFCISKYIIVDQNHISNPSHITLRSIVCIEIISTHSSVGLHGSLCIAGRIEPEYPPWQPICCRIQNHDLPLPLSRHSLLWVLYLRTIKTVRETVNHNCCHVCRRVKKSEFEFTFLYFKVYYQKSTPLAILLTIEFLINIRSQNLTYSLYLSLMTLRTSLTSVASNVELCQELPLWSILLWDLEEV